MKRTDRELYDHGFVLAYGGKDTDVEFDGLKPYREGWLQGAVSRSLGRGMDEARNTMIRQGRKWE